MTMSKTREGCPEEHEIGPTRRPWHKSGQTTMVLVLHFFACSAPIAIIVALKSSLSSALRFARGPRTLDIESFGISQRLSFIIIIRI